MATTVWISGASRGIGKSAALHFARAGYKIAAGYHENDDAMQSLMERKGIGKKVANCICLFGLGHREAFPVDTWVRRIVEQHYGGRFPCERYPGVQGIMQQWMFAYERREAGRMRASEAGK